MSRQPSRRMPKWKKVKAKQMSENMTSGEKALWKRLCSKKIGVWVYKQRPMYGYIVDFWIPCGIVIEVDGIHHRSRRAYDNRRDSVFIKHGIKTMRFTDDAVKKNTNAVIALIRREIRNREAIRKSIDKRG